MNFLRRLIFSILARLSSRGRAYAQVKTPTVLIIFTLYTLVFGSKEVHAIPKTASGFYYPMGSATWDHGGGSWLGRDKAHGGSYFAGDFHIGEDMFTPEGSNVYAVSDGNIPSNGIYTTSQRGTNKDVSFLGYKVVNGVYQGNSVIFVKHALQDGSQFLAEYMHVVPVVAPGSHVTAGQIIATVGPWPYSKPHLHFGIHPSITIPTNHWGIMDNSSWPEGQAQPSSTNGFVNPVDWLLTKTPKGIGTTTPTSPPPVVPNPVMASNSVPQVGSNADGRISVLVRGADGAIYHIRQTGPNAGWNQWESLGGGVAGNPMIGANLDGRLEFFVLGTNGSIYGKWQVAPNGAWSTSGGTNNSGWQDYGDYGGHVVSNPTVGRNQDGRLQFYVRGTDGAIHSKWQQSVGSNWSEWRSFGGGSLQLDPAVERNPGGGQELFVLGGDGSIYEKWQWQVNGSWSDWRNHNCGVIGKPVVICYRDRRLFLAVRGTDGQIYYRYQVNTGGDWSQWASVGQPFIAASNPAVALNALGSPQVFVRGTNGAIWTNIVNGSPNPWVSLGGALTSDPAVAVEKDGRLHVIAKGTNNQMYQRWQDNDLVWRQPWADLR